MIGFIRFKDIPQFLVGGAISIGFLLILMPLWIANPSLLGSPTSALIQLGFIVIISLIAAGPITRWLRQQAWTASTTLRVKKAAQEIENPSLLSNSSVPIVSASRVDFQRDTTEQPVSRPPNTTRTLAEVAEELAQRIGDAFSSSQFMKLFESETFSDGWTLNDGLAVWYFVGIVSLDVAVFTTFDSKEQSLAVRHACDRVLSKRWGMSRSVLDRFNAVMQKYGEPAFFGYTDCKSGEDLARFFSRVANLALGADLPADPTFEGTDIERILNGYEPKTMGAALGVAICHLFTQTTIAAKKILQATSIASPVIPAAPLF